MLCSRLFIFIDELSLRFDVDISRNVIYSL